MGSILTRISRAHFEILNWNELIEREETPRDRFVTYPRLYAIRVVLLNMIRGIN